MKPLAAPRRARGTPLRRRRQMKTRRRWTWRSLFHTPIPQLVVLVLVLGGFYALATSRVFAIRTVQVNGAPAAQSELFRRYCDCVGQNIFLTRPEDVRWRLGRIPYVDVTDVYARLPDRIVIDAAYRQPALLWRTTAATYTVDALGEVLYDVRHLPQGFAASVPTTATLPLVYSPHDTTFVSGQHVAAGTPGLAMVLSARTMMPRDLAPSIDLYRWSPYSGLTVHSRLGWWFSLGINLHDELRQRLNAVEGTYHTGLMQHRCNYVDAQVMPDAYCRYDPQWNGPLGPASR
jgi:hypothetical protein